MITSPLLSSASLTSHFADPYRAPQEVITLSYQALKRSPNIKTVLNALPFMTFILNRHRQIVFCNTTFLKMIQIYDIDDVLGMRIGEVLRCIHADTEPCGCGTAKECKVCGAVNAIIESTETRLQTKREARILVLGNDGYDTSLDLSITANPFDFNDEQFTIATLIDISDEKRRQVLERIFLHDLANVAGGIVGISELLQFKPLENRVADLRALHTASSQLFYELKAQQQLLLAENSEITVNKEQLSTRQIIVDVVDLFRNSINLIPCEIVIDAATDNTTFLCDRTLLLRVLSNMIKNAIEASTPLNQVKVCAEKNYTTVTFSVYNPSFIPKDVQMQIFQRSFSTRGPGRGLGTYSIKLLTERYLNGTVRFDSTQKHGTTFYVTLPLKTTVNPGNFAEAWSEHEEELVNAE